MIARIRMVNTPPPAIGRMFIQRLIARIGSGAAVGGADGGQGSGPAGWGLALSMSERDMARANAG